MYKDSKSSPSLIEAVRLENQQLMDQLQLKDKLVERLTQELHIRQETYEKYATTFRNSTDQAGASLSRELDREIELSTKLKSEVDQLNFQLRRTQKELQQLRSISQEKEKAYQHEIQLLAGQKYKKELVIESHEVESAEQQYMIKGIQSELDRSRCELTNEREVLRKNDDALKKLNEDNNNLRKALTAAEVSIKAIDE